MFPSPGAYVVIIGILLLIKLKFIYRICRVYASIQIIETGSNIERKKGDVPDWRCFGGGLRRVMP